MPLLTPLIDKIKVLISFKNIADRRCLKRNVCFDMYLYSWYLFILMKYFWYTNLNHKEGWTPN